MVNQLGDFFDKMDRLIEEVGTGHLVGNVKVDQIYAHYQHEHPEFRHPDGGGAFYLRNPFFAKSDTYHQKLAESVLNGKLKQQMIDNMEDLSTEVYRNAPWEFGDLRASGNPIVTDDGVEVYNRPPNVHRLDEAELKEKGHLRDLFDPHRYDYDRKKR